ncbi:MAG: glycosyltransferase [Gemmatimonadales bacterium]
MHQIRWFAPNRYCTLPVDALRRSGIDVATTGEEPAQLVFAADGVPAVAAWQFSRRIRAPLVVYLWDLPPWQLGQGRAHPVVPLAGRLVKVPRLWGAYPERAGYYSRLRYIARRAAAVWAPSEASRMAIEAHFDVPCERVPFCFDSDRFRRDAGWTRPVGVPVVLAISRLVPYKNHAAVIRAAAIVSSRPSVHIVGAGTEAAALRQLAAELGVALRLDEVWQSDQQVLDAYLGASVVVSASRFEGLGLTPLEAIALGIPTVASDIPTHREFTAGKARLVALDHDIALATAIDNALRFGGGSGVGSGPVLPELTIEACATRLQSRFERWLTRDS